MSRKTHVLVIEDHNDSRRALVLMLRREGFEVNDYEFCEGAERHLEGCDMDIALLDVRLPGRCGDDFGKELRQRCPNTMIVFITGEAILEPLKESVADCFVMRKPIDTDLLLELLKCFSSEAGYSSSLIERTGGRAGPANL